MPQPSVSSAPRGERAGRFASKETAQGVPGLTVLPFVSFALEAFGFEHRDGGR